MSKRTRLALAVTAAVCLTLIIGAKAQAWTVFRSGNSATVAAGETIDSSLWTAGRNIDIAGIVNGDVFCGGQDVNISGLIKGDVICGAQTINISGTVEGNIRIGAQTVNLSGLVGHNATVAAQTVNTDSRSRIGGDASLAANNLNLNGTIGRDLAVAGANLNLGGTVTRDIQSTAKTITLTSGAKVGGSISYTSQNQISKASGVQVGGTISQHQPEVRNHQYARLLVFGGIFALFVALMLIISALVITALLPQFVHRVSGQGIDRPWIALLTGLVAGIVVPIIFILLLLSVVGIPLAILLLLGWLLINLSSGLFSAYLVGRWVWRSQTNALLIVLAGSLILVILYFLPIINIIALVLASWLGEGMLLLQLKTHLRRPNYQVK